MKLLFELEEILQDWSPPFSKKTSRKEFEVSEKEGFDLTPNSQQPVFQVIENRNEKVLVEYRRDFTLKGYSQPGSKRIWLNKEETKEFSFLWGNNGITKKLTFKGSTPQKTEQKKETAIPETETKQTVTETVVHSTQEASAEGSQHTLGGSKVLESIETI